MPVIFDMVDRNASTPPTLPGPAPDSFARTGRLPDGPAPDA